MTDMQASKSGLGAALPDILSKLPQEWRGTTFKNAELLGREVFSSRLLKLVREKGVTGITTSDLEGVGNAEDYFRVATNVSTMLEAILALHRELDGVSQVFTFGSAVMPIVAVVLTVGDRGVHVYTGTESLPFAETLQLMLKKFGGSLEFHQGVPPASRSDNKVVHVALQSSISDAADMWNAVEAVIAPNVLYITNKNAIDTNEIMIIRKRMATPVTTPVAEAMLQEIAGVPVTANKNMASQDEVAEFYAHLQELSGTAVDVDNNPVVFTAGLPTIASFWLALIDDGGADICMASTAYGGSSQLTDVVSSRAGSLVKHTYDIQGTATVATSIKALLDKLAAHPETLQPTTVLFTEIPTNPDMKVPEMDELASILNSYQAATNRRVVLLVDGTFAPSSNIMEKMRNLSPDLPVLVFLSMSKSVSRGITTAGCLIANHTNVSTSLLSKVRDTSAMLDTNAKPDQMVALCNNHRGVEERCQTAYKVAVATGEALVNTVKDVCNHDMSLAFVSPQNAAKGFTTSTFSFNLPPRKNATAEINAAHAQKFVDLLTVHSEFKPCVSFGQDNGLVYATVPATSTQGAIKEEDKAKQAVGGVQLVRLSFPPKIDTEKMIGIITNAVVQIYA